MAEIQSECLEFFEQLAKTPGPWCTVAEVPTTIKNLLPFGGEIPTYDQVKEGLNHFNVKDARLTWIKWNVVSYDKWVLDCVVQLYPNKAMMDFIESETNGKISFAQVATGMKSHYDLGRGTLLYTIGAKALVIGDEEAPIGEFIYMKGMLGDEPCLHSVKLPDEDDSDTPGWLKVTYVLYEDPVATVDLFGHSVPAGMYINKYIQDYSQQGAAALDLAEFKKWFLSLSKQ